MEGGARAAETGTAHGVMLRGPLTEYSSFIHSLEGILQAPAINP